MKQLGINAVGLTITLGLIGLTSAGEAGAGCANFASAGGLGSPGPLKPALYRQDETDSTAFRTVADGGFWHASIVGLWKVEFLAKNNTNGIPDGFLIDFGTAIWNGDGTETMISGGRNPGTGDVCMGAWHQVGPATFKLNHVALAWQSGSRGPISGRRLLSKRSPWTRPTPPLRAPSQSHSTWQQRRPAKSSMRPRLFRQRRFEA
jgi:hypothetical protein